MNGKIMTDPLTWIDMQSDQVTVDNVVSERRKETRVWMMNKPRGLVGFVIESGIGPMICLPDCSACG